MSIIRDQSEDSAPKLRGLAVRPLLSAIVFFCLGIVLHPFVWHTPGFWTLILVGLLVVAGVFSRRSNLAAFCLAGAIVAAGVSRAQLANYSFASDDIALYVTDAPRLAELELYLPQTPTLQDQPGQRRLPPRQSGVAAVRAVKTWQGWTPAGGQVRFGVSDAEPRLAAGQTVRAVGMLAAEEPVMNPGQFDWKDYDRREGIIGTFHAIHGADVEIISSGAGAPLASAGEAIRQWLALGFSRDAAADRALLMALCLGDRGVDLKTVQRNFQKTGTSHLLSSNGFRLAVLAGMVYVICWLLRLSPGAASAVTLTCVTAWGLMTVPTPQALRPVIVAGAVGLGLRLRRGVDAVNLLTLAAAVILIARPLELYAAGFQFSFIIVLAMLLLTRPLLQWLTSWEDRDLLTLERFGKLTPVQRLRRTIWHRLLEVLSAALVAWAASLPLVAWHFEQFTPWAVPIGVVLSPLVFVALGSAFIKLGLTLLAPGHAALWAAGAAFPASLLRRVIGLCTRLPWPDVPVTRPPMWAIVAFYVLLFAPLLPIGQARLARWAKRLGPVLAGTALFLPGVPGFAWQSTLSGRLRLELLSIGAGQCAVLETGDGRTMMIDAGSSTLADPLHDCIEPFLHHEGRRRLDEIYLSHGDFDHISAVEDALDECDVSQVTTSPFFRRHAVESVPCAHLLAKLDTTGHCPRQATLGDAFDYPTGVHLQVLWPPKQCDMNSNNAGMVLRLTYACKSILFPADIQDPAMEELLKAPAKLKSDILIAPHHGSSESLTAAFVSAVDPQIILSSNSGRLTKKQRDFEKLIDHRKLLRTGDWGAIQVDIDRAGKIKVTPFLKEPLRRGMGE